LDCDAEWFRPLLIDALNLILEAIKSINTMAYKLSKLCTQYI
jgi:hypothetical protein